VLFGRIGRIAVGASAFVEVYVDAPLATCESRDPKGLYRKARSGKIPEFTGISSPYEPPEAPALHLHTGAATLGECAAGVHDLLQRIGLLTAERTDPS
jgi:adenylylsulfate kinase